MAEIRLTAAQQAVVENRGGALLVSAAAGSGKTKVLIDRLLSMVCDPDDPANLDDFLIITYTNAAAAELRGKISAALGKRLAKEPANRHLQRQLTRIYLAQISTVHAFCASTLRSYACTLDIPADFRVAEEQETELLQQKVLEELLDDSYETVGENGKFRALANKFGYGRDDRRLSELILSLYEKMRCRVDVDGWLRACEESYVNLNADAGETVWGAYLIDQMQKTIQICREKMAAFLPELDRDAVLSQKYAPVFQENLSQMDGLLLAKTWDGVLSAKVDSFGRIPGISKCEDPDLKDRAQSARKAVWEAVKAAQRPFYADSQTVMAELTSTSDAVCGLVELLREFERRFSEEKRRRKLFDFSDLEHQMLRLVGRPGHPTAAAREIAGLYREILVDEYQDSNAVQEAIFQAVSRDGKNLFMVGDVKQSIYRFRLADPGIFQQKYETFASSIASVPGEPRKILLSDNFRSRREILQAANDVFSLVMNRQSTELEYGEAEALRPGLPYLPTPQKKVELHCIDLDIVTSEDEADARRTEEEAEFVAERIQKLLRDGTPIQDGDSLRPVAPGDIVILMRSPGISAAVYQRALLHRGISCVTDRAGSILETTEGECFLALLEVLDNPHRDISLAALLLSPVFGFTPDELAQPRTALRSGDLYDCLCAYPEKSKKLQQFLNWLQAMREQAQELSLTELLDEAERTIHFTDSFAALPDGTVRTANLAALREQAAAFEAGGSRSLMQFCTSLEQAKERGDSVQAPESRKAQNAVSIMTIHKSKGLEFPVVILADLAHRMNLTDNSRTVLLDSELLIGTDVTDEASRSIWSGIAKMAIADKHQKQTVAEELRVLYVAMTRAKEMLIMTYCEGKLESTLKKWNEAISKPLSPEVPGKARKLGDWILMAALLRDEAEPLFAVAGGNEWHEKQEDAWEIRLHSAAQLREERSLPGGSFADLQTPKSNRQAVLDVLSEPYAHLPATRIPSKLTATQLKGRLHDQEAAEDAGLPFAPVRKQYERPFFLRDQPLTGAEKGNATHLFMQFVRYEACTSAEGIEEELSRMLRDHFLTPRQAEAVEKDRVLRLFTSAFGKRILAAENVQREFKFSVMTDAGDYDPAAAGEQVMLQGVVDCFWEEPEGLVIVDFKTDRISGDPAWKRETYRPQITAYAKALGRIFQKPVKVCYLYFFAADAAERI